jgi:hypothetical protein
MMSEAEFDELCKALEPLTEDYENLDPEYRKHALPKHTVGQNGCDDSSD